jgi:hypothetical protein
MTLPCIQAAQALIADRDQYADFAPLLERSAVITLVTAVEVYFRDMLDVVFRLCAPEFFTPCLRELHSEKYDVDDLLDIYRNGVHPLELVVAAQSFQNADQVERVFSKLMGTSLWGALLQLQVRVAEKPEEIFSWTHENLSSLKRTFALRHELVHDPARHAFIDDDVCSDLLLSQMIVFGCDVVLNGVVQEHLDDEVVKARANAT